MERSKAESRIVVRAYSGEEVGLAVKKASWGEGQLLAISFVSVEEVPPDQNQNQEAQCGGNKGR